MPAFELEEVSIGALQERMASGAETSRSSRRSPLERHRRARPPGADAPQVIEINPDALAIADRLDARAQGRAAARPAARHPDPDQGQHRHRRPHEDDGRLARARRIASRRATRSSSQRLREAGAVMLGKTNLSEWANFRSTHSTSGWSGRGGQTRNPYALDRNPCGSSSGSGRRGRREPLRRRGRHRDRRLDRLPGVAQRRWSASSRRSAWSAAPASSRSRTRQDTAGPMARTVADAAALLAALAGADPRDAATTTRRGTRAARLHAVPRRRTARGRAHRRRAQAFFGYSARADGWSKAAIDGMKAAGAMIVDPADIPTAAQFGDAELEVLLYEFKADLNAYLGARSAVRAGVKSLADVIAFNEANTRTRDAVLRPGAVRPGRGEGPADRPGVPRGAGRSAEAVARPRASTPC